MDFTKDIYINKNKICEDSEIVLLYKGFLFSDNLTDDVYISYGYGNMWENKCEIKMKPSTFGYLTTIHISSGNELQFCFRSSSGHWDNNNNKNYVLPIEKAEPVTNFEPIVETVTEIPFELPMPDYTPIDNTETTFKPSVVTSTPVELYKTVDLQNITKQTIPNDTVITQINLTETTENTKNIVSETVIKTPNNYTVTEPFAEIAKTAKEHSVTAFDDDKVTTGSVYVNSITQPIPMIVENSNEKALTVENTEKNSTFTLITTLTEKIKLAFTKLVKLIKTSFHFNEEKD